ncbi:MULTISPECIES: hypothetical protein [unclassified Rhizobium]|uniref:hypothetical protein n=1 Tax=unclassified Rhizobium TaxID=2613769 RepID=UPI00161BFD73|nr:MULTISPECIES: hypothetical protein [unclassified Rhizobium]MBB3541512.1 hypothetical protein [Rhizobium sp. BK399]MCS3740908.1 hypothetical protein [Rhizobium sp. BK661]MCS4092256.1 hypothetical protein [Rhizobium sp. BK176]
MAGAGAAGAGAAGAAGVAGALAGGFAAGGDAGAVDAGGEAGSDAVGAGAVAVEELCDLGQYVAAKATMTTIAASTIQIVLLFDADVFTGFGLLKSFVMLVLL